MMNEKRFNVFLTRPACCFPYTSWGLITLINHCVLFFWPEHEMMIRFLLKYARGIRCESLVLFFQTQKVEKYITVANVR